MATIVGAVAVAHSPFWDINAPVQGEGASFARAVHGLGETVRALDIDTAVIFGPDHFRNFFYDLMPAFCIGMDKVSTFGEFGSRRAAWNVDANLAQNLQQSVFRQGFDPAISFSMGIDHGVAQPYDVLFPEHDVAAVPIMINANGGPRPSFRRCLDFGRAVGAAITESESNARVLLIGSGGMSHWVRQMSLESPNMPPELRRYVVEGRTEARTNSDQRDADFARRRAENITGRVNEIWDLAVLKDFAAGSAEGLCATSDDDIETMAGNGAHELRTWAAVLGAWGGPLPTVAYEPVPSWLTGMGCIANFR